MGADALGDVPRSHDPHAIHVEAIVEHQDKEEIRSDLDREAGERRI